MIHDLKTSSIATGLREISIDVVEIGRRVLTRFAFNERCCHSARLRRLRFVTRHRSGLQATREMSTSRPKLAFISEYSKSNHSPAAAGGAAADCGGAGPGGGVAGQAPRRPRPTRLPHPIPLPRPLRRPGYELKGTGRVTLARKLRVCKLVTGPAITQVATSIRN